MTTESDIFAARVLKEDLEKQTRRLGSLPGFRQSMKRTASALTATRAAWTKKPTGEKEMPQDSALFESVEKAELYLGETISFLRDSANNCETALATIRALFADLDAQAKLIGDFRQAELAWISGERNAQKIISAQALKLAEWEAHYEDWCLERSRECIAQAKRIAELEAQIAIHWRAFRSDPNALDWCESHEPMEREE